MDEKFLKFAIRLEESSQRRAKEKRKKILRIAAFAFPIIILISGIILLAVCILF